MAHVFLIKAPWTNKDFSFLKELEEKFSMPLLVFTPFCHQRELLLKAGLKACNPYKFQKLGEGEPLLFVVVDWPNLAGKELREFRYFLLSGDCPCLLLQSEDLIFEEAFLKAWVMGESVRYLWEGECPLPPFDSRTMRQNLDFLKDLLPFHLGKVLAWLLQGQSKGNLLAWEGEKQDRGNRHQKGSFSRKTCDRNSDDEKWAQRFGPLLWGSWWWKKAQGLNFRARLHDAGGSFSLENENRAA